jgi:hypothetical protein
MLNQTKAPTAMAGNSHHPAGQLVRSLRDAAGG